MKGIGRNLVYWGCTLEKNAIMMMVFGFFFSGMMAFWGEGDFWAEYVEIAPTYFGMIIVCTVFTNAINGMTSFFPLTW